MRKKKGAITLLEIMVVIFLIGIIGSVVGYNIKGSLDEGKAFRSKKGAEQIEEILSLEISDEHSIDTVADNAEEYLRRSGLCKDPKKMLLDGWGFSYEITVEDGAIKVVSKKLQQYELAKNAKITKKP